MNSSRVRYTLSALVFLIVANAFTSCKTPSHTMTYKTGTIWNYKTRPGEDYSRVHLSHKYRAKGYGTVYYIFIEHKTIQGVYSGGYSAVVTSESLDKSLTTQASGEKARDMTDGFDVWKESFLHEGAIPYSESIAEILSDQE